MTTYAGGTQARSGYYIDPSSFTFTSVASDGAKLPGGAEARWMRVPVMLVMVAAPVLGGLFVVAFPFIGFGVAVHAVGRKLGLGARAGAKEIAATVAPPWAPGEAHLTGKPGENGEAEGAPATDPRIEELEKTIGEKRSPRP
jgi:hypothetical protein